MSRYYTKNTYTPVNPRNKRNRYHMKNAYTPVNPIAQDIEGEAQRAERETSQMPQQGLRERKGWKCDECGIVLKDNPKMLRIHFARVFCIGCYAEQPSKNYRKQKGRRSYKRFMERYGKEWQWHRRRAGMV